MVLMTTADEPLPVLIENSRHRFPATRLRAIKSLGKLGQEASTALPVLTLSLDDADPKVREAAAAAIGHIGPAALTALAGMLTHPDKYVRRNAVWALSKIGPKAQPLRHRLCLVLKDDDPRTASGAAQALGALGEFGSDAVPALAEAMRGTNIVLCRLAAKALSQIGRPALPTLVSHLRHHDPFVRGEAAVALGWMGPLAAAAVPMLIDLLQTSSPVAAQPEGVPVPGIAGTPPTGVAPKPGDPPNSVDAARASAAQALGRIGPAAATAISALNIALNDPIDAVRDAAELSLRQIREMA
jgi:HEAT repeat protein